MRVPPLTSRSRSPDPGGSSSERLSQLAALNMAVSLLDQLSEGKSSEYFYKTIKILQAPSSTSVSGDSFRTLRNC